MKCVCLESRSPSEQTLKRIQVEVDIFQWGTDGILGFGDRAKSLGGGFKYLLFSSLPGEMIQFDQYFSNWLKPPTRSPLLIQDFLQTNRR